MRIGDPNPEVNGLTGSYGGVAGRFKSCYYNLRIRTEAEITDEKAKAEAEKTASDEKMRDTFDGYFP